MISRSSFAASLPVQGNPDIEAQLLDRAFQRWRIKLLMTDRASTVVTMRFWFSLPQREMLT